MEKPSLMYVRKVSASPAGFQPLNDATPQLGLMEKLLFLLAPRRSVTSETRTVPGMWTSSLILC